MDEFLHQFKSNRIVRYTILCGFVLIAFVFSNKSLFTTLIAVSGLVLGRLSYNDHVDNYDV
ncbi:MAG: hypothetical protein HQM12_14945 [SAR324 cluster bacterium]|nr:hypothetical protein [SAR324 cluster bacterium]